MQLCKSIELFYIDFSILSILFIWLIKIAKRIIKFLNQNVNIVCFLLVFIYFDKKLLIYFF